jgi:hypothetical protein
MYEECLIVAIYFAFGVMFFSLHHKFQRKGDKSNKSV